MDATTYRLVHHLSVCSGVASSYPQAPTRILGSLSVFVHGNSSCSGISHTVLFTPFEL